MGFAWLAFLLCATAGYASHSTTPTVVLAIEWSEDTNSGAASYFERDLIERLNESGKFQVVRFDSNGVEVSGDYILDGACTLTVDISGAPKYQFRSDLRLIRTSNKRVSGTSSQNDIVYDRSKKTAGLINQEVFRNFIHTHSQAIVNDLIGVQTNAPDLPILVIDINARGSAYAPFATAMSECFLEKDMFRIAERTRLTSAQNEQRRSETGLSDARVVVDALGSGLAADYIVTDLQGSLPYVLLRRDDQRIFGLTAVSEDYDSMEERGRAEAKRLIHLYKKIHKYRKGIPVSLQAVYDHRGFYKRSGTNQYVWYRLGLRLIQTEGIELIANNKAIQRENRIIKSQLVPVEMVFDERKQIAYSIIVKDYEEERKCAVYLKIKSNKTGNVRYQVFNNRSYWTSSLNGWNEEPVESFEQVTRFITESIEEMEQETGPVETLYPFETF